MRLIETSQLSAALMLDDFLVPRRRAVGHAEVVGFLSDVSREILSSKNCRQYPDVMTFGYFCRKSSIERALQIKQSISNRFGWGFAVHIAPSNVPVNFGFSFVFGLLSGNNNLVRLPSTTWPQVDLLVSVFETVAQSEKYEILAKNNAFVRTERDSVELLNFVANSDALVVWGGDSTVATFRKLEKKPRCVELYFPDRKSSLVINALTIAESDENDLQKLAAAFFNDTYLVDNNACSSPRRIFWVGEESDVAAARNKLWAAIDGVIKAKGYDLNIIAKIDRYLDVMKSVEIAEAPVTVEKISEDIWLTSRDEETLIGRLGRYSESRFVELAAALKALDDDEQTLTYMGFDKEYIEQIVLDSDIIVDRVVPAGMALDIGFVWDGVDVLNRLSRFIDIR
ncbi:MAG: acyl-CoA reductase [Sedimenticola sp.]|nr:acyl-CoA reductase [Sedimenticola sp.]